MVFKYTKIMLVINQNDSANIKILKRLMINVEIRKERTSMEILEKVLCKCQYEMS